MNRKEYINIINGFDIKTIEEWWLRVKTSDDLNCQLQQGFDDIEESLDRLDELEDRIEKAIEYITSYESIEEIQHCERIEDNKELDYKTMVEMNRRYLIVHDKLLDILRGEEK